MSLHVLFVILVDRVSLFLFFCFFKQKTAYEMRISDWSSDVCSSDLERHRLGVGIVDPEDLDALLDPEQHDAQELLPQRLPMQAVEIDVDDVLVLLRREIGRASGRERVCQYV